MNFNLNNMINLMNKNKGNNNNYIKFDTKNKL